MTNRLTTGALALGLVLSTVALPAAGQTSGFTDVAADDTHRDAIARGAALGLLEGTSATTFAPNRSLTRGQAATVIARTLDATDVALPAASSGPAFRDIGAPHEGAIRRLAAVDIVRGIDGERFAPQQPVTRDQLASLVVRAVAVARGEELSAQGDDPFQDVDPDSVHAQSITIASELGLLRGRSATVFAPREDTRRSQGASVVTRLYDLLDVPAAETANGEVWALDQGTDRIHVHDGDDGFAEITTIDVGPETLAAMGFDGPAGEVTVPHMIEFDSQERYAFIASTAGGVTIVVDARTKEVVEVLDTGAGSHMAAVTPDDSAVWVAVIGAQTMVEIPLDLDADEPTFEVGRTLPMGDLLEPLEDANDWTYPSASPVCHQYTTDSSEAWITLGPGWNQGGLVVLDLESGELVEDAAYDPAEVKANCGVSIDDDQVLVNWSGQVVEGDNTPGETYVLDPDTYALESTIPANGLDTHGLRITNDGSEYWQVNRISNELLVLDADTLEVVDEVDDIADTPDILDFSPDGELAYITQRGPTPRSGAIHAATGQQPGVAVVETATFTRRTVIEHEVVRDEEGNVRNDVHGVGVRTATD